MLVVYGVPIGLLLVLGFVYRVVANEWIPRKLIEGADGHPSTSKLQFFLWTLVVLFSYLAIYCARAQNEHWEAIETMPTSLLLAMGVSMTTMAAAKGITVSYVSSGQVSKPAGAGPGIFTDDAGFPDLSKFQMIAWTLIAIGIYLVRVAGEVQKPLPNLPDIDAVLMVLMSLGQGAYLAKKLTSTDVPKVPKVKAASAAN